MEGCVPDVFITAAVIPLIEKANIPADDTKTYRPISGLSFISKLVEQVIAEQMLENIHVLNLDHRYRSAYKAFLL